MPDFLVKPLDESTLPDFARLVEKHTVSSSFLHHVTISIFERQGFQRTRRLGKNHWVVTRMIDSQT